MIDHRRDVGSLPLWLERQEIADDAKDVLASFAWRKDVLNAVGEQHHADAVVVAHGGHGEHGSELTGKLALESLDRPEPFRPGEIDSEHDRELAFLDVPFDERPPHAGGDVPVDSTDFVSRLILTDFGELHPLSLEHAAVFTGEERVDEAAGTKLNELYLPQDLRRHTLADCFATGVGGCRLRSW